MLDNGIIFDARIAEKFSVEEAIVINKLFGWIKHNATNGKNFKEGRYWTFNSISAFKKYFPFWNESKIKRILIDLAGCTEKSESKPKHEPIIIKGNFNKSSFDRTIWYSFTDDFFAYLVELGYNLSSDIPQAENGYSADGQMEIPQAEEQYQLFNQNNNTKEEKLYKKKEDSDFYAALLEIGVTEHTAQEWMDVRKRLKAINSQAALDRVKRSVQALATSHNFTPEDAIRIAVEKGWKGVDSQYFDRIPPKPTTIAQTPKKTISPYEKIDEQGNRYYLQGYGKHKVIIPAEAPPRPSETMFWSNFTKSWYQP